MAIKDQQTGSKSGSGKVRKEIEEAMERSENERKHELMKRRIELAIHGIKSYRQKKVSDSVIAFQSYLRVLEEMKGVSEGGLTPSLFDHQKELPEILLISGVYWDLVKLFDRTKSLEKRKDFLHYMEKFVLFSKGMPFQTVCAETLRKYIQSKRAVHKEDFKSAYRMLANTRCFVATALVDEIDSETMPKLRNLRDQVLMKRYSGKVVIFIYHLVGPILAISILKMPGSTRKTIGKTLDLIAKSASGGF